MELYALDGNLAVAGVVEYKSLIWIDRYSEVGSCEVYAPASENNILIIKAQNYLFRSDRDTVMLIKDVKTSGNADTGMWITAYGYDAKCYLDQRVNKIAKVFSTYFDPSHAMSRLSMLLQAALVATGTREALKKANGQPLFTAYAQSDAGSARVNATIKGMAWGQVARLLCGNAGWGYRVVLVNGQLRLDLYAGSEKAVTFSRNLSNIGNTEYEHDIRGRKNVFIINTDDQFVNAEYGNADGVDRVEVPVLLSTPRTIPYSVLRDLFDCVNKRLTQSGTTVQFRADAITIPIMDCPWFLDRLNELPQGETDPYDIYFFIETGVLGRAYNMQVADVTDDTEFTDINVSFYYRLLVDAAAEYEGITDKDSIDAEILDSQFVYGRDYSLGDIVTVDAGAGPAPARIVEVLECFDENGYRLEPRTSYSDIIDDE